MTSKEKQIIVELKSLIKRVKEHTDNIEEEERIPQLELDALVTQIEKVYQKAVALKYFHAYLDEIITDQVDELVEAAQANEIVAQEEKSDENLEVSIERMEEKPIENSTSTELPTATKETTHEKLVSESSDTSVVDRLQKQPISDLKQAIGINDKFQYINELFGGNADEFNQKIEQLNQLSSVDEALQALGEGPWKQENDVAKSFLGLVERRYL